MGISIFVLERDWQQKVSGMKYSRVTWYATCSMFCSWPNVTRPFINHGRCLYINQDHHHLPSPALPQSHTSPHRMENTDTTLRLTKRRRQKLWFVIVVCWLLAGGWRTNGRTDGRSFVLMSWKPSRQCVTISER